MTRSPAVAGQFYPGNPADLERALDRLLPGPGATGDATGILVPHAGYPYSGGVAARVFSAVRLPRRFVILCPNHTGHGEDLAINLDGEWATPLGNVPVDAELAADLAARCPGIRDDGRAHAREHSLEVQLPFLQHLVGDFRFVPLCIRTHELPVLLSVGEAIAAAVESCPEPVLLVISSDMTHYEPAEVARRKDMRAIARLEALDPEGLHRTVLGEGISMCGIAPAVAGLAAARSLGASGGKLVQYATSGAVTGELDQVVGSAGLVFAP